MLDIKPLMLADCATVAATHAACLSTPFKTTAGARLLQTRYEAISTGAGSSGYICNLDEHFAGFICGIWDRRMLRQALFKKLPLLAVNAARHCLSDPKFLLIAAGALLHQLSRPRDPLDENGYEMRPLVVLPAFRGQGVADRLIEQVYADARQRGFERIFLFVEKDNLAAIKLYTRVGFLLEAKKRLPGGLFSGARVEVLRYSLTLPGRASSL